jgi:hypothetical protein
MPSNIALAGNKLFSRLHLSLSDIGQAVFEICPAHIIYIYLPVFLFHMADMHSPGF